MNDYQQANKNRFDRTGGRIGLCITLSSGPAFWSRGWRGCQFCGGDVKGHTPLVPFIEYTLDGVRSGWRCA